MYHVTFNGTLTVRSYGNTPEEALDNLPNIDRALNREAMDFTPTDHEPDVELMYEDDEEGE